MSLPQNYVEQVYAGILGKIIGVYLGRPFEGWTYDRIMAELGPINYYVNERLNAPLIVTDDDITGSFTFLRALPDYGNTLTLTPKQIGQTWLNYIIENRTILWWGGMGNSTEHTAYLRLKHGIPAPLSGSTALNGKVVAEQIGAQIFIDGWAMIAPGDPERAADFARRAASVSHDGEAVYGAQVLAAMEAYAFVEPNIDKLLDCGLSFIPHDSVIAKLICDVREWHIQECDWRITRKRIVSHYGYDRYGGNCHMVPNHALILLGLLYGDDDFQKSLMIVNTSGWDTDCNSGNLGCLLGIKNGLAGIEAGPDWRGPVRDQLYLPTADGGRAITDAVTETYHIANIGRALSDQEPLAPKNGARFHWELPGALQSWQLEVSEKPSGTVEVENVVGHSNTGTRSLALHYRHLTLEQPARVFTPTFLPPEAVDMSGYGLLAAPTLYAGQTVRAFVSADEHNAEAVVCCLFIQTYGGEDTLERTRGPQALLDPGATHTFEWRIDDTSAQPIAQIGVELSTLSRADGVVYLDYVTWDGTPDLVFRRPASGGNVWRRVWVNGVDHFDHWWPEAFRPIQNEGRGLVITGTREWHDYQVSAAITPHMTTACGIGARVQGMRRYYALLLYTNNIVRLVKALDGDTVLAEAEFAWQFGGTYTFQLEVTGKRVRGWIDNQPVCDVVDDQPLTCGGVALIVEEGRMGTDAVTVRPVA